MTTLLDRFRTDRAIAKRWSLASIIVSITAGVALRQFVGGFVAVPGRQGVESLVWPLAGGIVAVVVAAVAGALHELPERTAARSAVRQRLSFLAVVVTFVVIGSLAGGPTDVATARVRNDCCLLGIACGSAAALPRPAAWVPVAMIVTITWFFGPVGGGHAPHAWALLLQPPRHIAAATTAAVVTVCGLAVFVQGAPVANADRAPRRLIHLAVRPRTLPRSA